MKTFAICCVVVVALLTGIAELSAYSGTQAAAIGAGGFGVLLIALCFYVLTDIRALLLRGK
jgi:hypothetical protein